MDEILAFGAVMQRFGPPNKPPVVDSFTRWSVSRALDQALPGIVTAGIVAIVALLVNLQGESKSTQIAINGLQDTISQLRGEMQRKSEQWEQRWMGHDERIRDLEMKAR